MLALLVITTALTRIRLGDLFSLQVQQPAIYPHFLAPGKLFGVFLTLQGLDLRGTCYRASETLNSYSSDDLRIFKEPMELTGPAIEYSNNYCLSTSSSGSYLPVV